MDIDTYTNYDERKEKLFKDYTEGYIKQIERNLQETDSKYYYTKIIGKPKTKEEYDANVKYLEDENRANVIREIASNLQDKDRILRIEEYKKVNASRKTYQSNEEKIQAFPKGIQELFFEWTTKEANNIYKKLLDEQKKITKKEIVELTAKDAEKLAAQQKAISDKNAEEAEEAAAEKIYPKQVERTDYDNNDDDDDDVKRRNRLILITHLDIRGDKDGIDSGYSEENGKEKRFWVDPDTEEHGLYDFYDKDHYLGELEGYQIGKTKYDSGDIDIQYQGILRRRDQKCSDYEDGKIIITWYDEDEEYFNRQIEMKKAALKLSEGQRRNFWKVQWSSTNKQIFYTQYDYIDQHGDFIIYYNSSELPDYDITKGDYLGVKKPTPSAVASVTPPKPIAPKGWVTILSKSKNKWYYLNSTTGATQWHRPDHASIGGKRKTKKRNATKKAKKSKRNATKKAKKSKRNKTKTKKGSKKV